MRTYDDWKTTDDTPQPDPNRCEECGHPEDYCDCRCCCGEPDERAPHAGDALEAVVDDMLLTDEQREEIEEWEGP